MSPTPADLVSAAARVRAVARRLELDVEPLVRLGGRATWEGTAAEAYLRGARSTRGQAGEVADSLDRLARRLEDRARVLREWSDADRAEAERLDQLGPRPSPGGR